jgi:hypothetical protein
MTSFTAICATWSRTVGIPSGAAFRLTSGCTAAAPARAGPACLEVSLDPFEERLNAALLDGPDRLAVHPCCASVAAHSLPRLLQDVTPADPVMQRVETPRAAPLGDHVKPALEFSHFVYGGVGPHGHASRLLQRRRDQSRAPSLHPVVPGFPGTTDPSGSLPAPCAFGICLMRLVSARRGLPARVSRVPHRSFAACCRPYLGGAPAPVQEPGRCASPSPAA